MQVHVERTDVEEREIEKLGRREIHVGEQARWRRVLRGFVEAAEEVLDSNAAMPADNARRDLVAERKGEHGGVIAELSDLRHEFLPDLAFQRWIVEKRDGLRPREPA